MLYINYDKLESMSRAEFCQRPRYPHAVWEELIQPAAFEALVETLPPLEQFKAAMGKKRRAGQTPHDRYSLEYRPGLEVPEPWLRFIEELRGDRYRSNIARLFGTRTVEFRFHWHYTPTGCSVSPHCDQEREWGSHLFYFNTAKEWNPEWGGHTLLLEDGGQLDRNSAPAFEDFESEKVVSCVGNRSALLARGDHAWHGVREITCPEGYMRKVFIVVINPTSLRWKIRDALIRKDIQRL